jgi:hypothetical protein
MPTIIDYSAGRPSGAAVKNNGHAGVIRYVGTPGRTKNITKAEYADMAANGRGVALVYENHAGDAGGGFAGGVTAARTARADADAIGFPSNRPIYFAVDSDQVTSGQFLAAMAYLDGAASVLGRPRVGVYGEYDIVEMALPGHAAYGWQTAAWSKGKRSAKAALFQKIGTVVVGGIACDENDVLNTDWGQHNFTGFEPIDPSNPATQGAELMERKHIVPPNAEQNTIRVLLSGTASAGVVVRPKLGADGFSVPMWVGNIYAWGSDHVGVGGNPNVPGYNSKLTSHRRFNLPGALWADIEYSAAVTNEFDVDCF